MALEITRDEAGQLFTDYSKYIYRTALLLTRSETLADDITQETFIQVFRKFNTFDSTKPIKPWIYKISINTMRNMLRKQKWLTFVGYTPEIADKELIEDIIIQNEESMLLWKEIDQLSLKSREILILHYYTELKLIEVSEILGVSIGTCKSRLHTALTTLRRQILKSETIESRKRRASYERN
ncbi:RNA polymerase sigma factor (sigma-70 family) [Paenibacillus sp. W4I10]|uniref:RNA polymerase sigma factor n=1 Tax=Paenibacillus sp. W4I10 TaxID=3042298 RepID=UPI00277D56B9|nr:sigma-70 family RNA polymerase sigma factor [Paenibacillus sp. W4I10]MDQ0720264.1 RNA polymerase sigma factor (sigma-70 family) [Paenibacillus sp. W4I10]